MKLCICTSSFKSNETFDLFIDSLFLQTYKNWELIICDDNEDDEFFLHIQNYLKDKRIKLTKNYSNLGLTISLIKSIDKLPNDSFIVRMDDDEIHGSEYLISIANLFHRGHDLIIFTENYFLGFLIKKLHCKSPYISSLFLCLIGNIASHGGLSYTKECYLKASGYDKNFRYSQDYNLLIKMLKVSNNPYFTNQLNFKPFNIERTSYKVSKDNRNIQKIFALISIIGLIDNQSINKNKSFIFFIILLMVSIPTKLLRSLFSR